jgi:hypothetical protein
MVGRADTCTTSDLAFTFYIIHDDVMLIVLLHYEAPLLLRILFSAPFFI